MAQPRPDFDAAAHERTRTATATVWWLRPELLFWVVVVGSLSTAAAMRPELYGRFETSKFVGWNHVAFGIVTAIVFSVGCFWGRKVGGTSPPVASFTMPGIGVFLWCAVVLCVLGYVIWFMYAIKNGLSPATLRHFLLTDDTEVADELKKELFKIIPGITSLVNFGVAAAALGIVLAWRGERTAWLAVAAVAFFATLQSFVVSERLKLLEIIIPASLLGLRLWWFRKPTVENRAIAQASPIVAVLMICVMFGGFEYFRSWRYYKDEFSSITEFTFFRLNGYYATAHNNGAMQTRIRGRWPLPYATLKGFWKFPGISKTPFGYEALTGVDPDDQYEALLEQFASGEMNNEGGWFQPTMDFGPIGAMFFWLLYGLVAGRVYRSFLDGSLGGLLAYPIVFVSILETPRYLYICSTRVVPPLLLIGLLVLVFTPIGKRSSGAGGDDGH